jgi:signal transduction histidine kinase/ActR/RegA family two-component response regulator
MTAFCGALKAMFEFFQNLFNTADFPPRWRCGEWTPGHGWLHILSDAAIWSAYYAIPFVLAYVAYRRRDVPFRLLFWLFGAFILACGTTHLLEALVFWWPAYRFLGLVKLATAIASWATVIALIPLIPKTLQLRTPNQLEEEVIKRTSELAAANASLEREIAERKRAEDEIRKLNGELCDADQRKDEFLAMLAHELRNPLAPIRSGLELLAMRGEKSELVPLMQDQVSHLVRLVDDLLHVSRLLGRKVELRRELVRVDKVVEQAIAIARPSIDAHQHVLAVSLPTEPIWLDADPVRLVEVVANLLHNAAKYTPSGGEVNLVVERQADEAVVRVIDTGVGIEPDLLPLVFDLFVQGQRPIDRSLGGLGIGLTVVRNLVEMHGGTVEARSGGPGQGAEFIVHLPATPAGEKKGPASQEPDPTRPHRVLIVEDHPVAAKMLALALREAGNHEVRVVDDGYAALETAQAFRPELVLLDIGLPGIDGYEVAMRLRKMPDGDKFFIVAVTGYGQEEDRRRSQEAGFDEHLLKPVALDRLRDLFRHPKLLHQRLA